MGLNFGAIAQGISSVLEEDKKLKAAEKRLERQFENDVEKISMRTALDRETEELKRRREERKKIKELLTYYTPDQAALIAKQGNVDTALEFGQFAIQNNQDPQSFIEMADVNPLTKGWQPEDFDTANKMVEGAIEESPTSGPTPEIKQFAGFDELDPEQQKPDLSLRFKPLKNNKKINSFEAGIMHYQKKIADLDPNNPEDATKIKNFKSQIDGIISMAQKLEVATDTGQDSDISKINPKNTFTSIIKTTPTLSGLVELDLQGQIEKIRTGNTAQLALGFADANKNFNNFMNRADRYKRSPQFQGYSGILLDQAINYKKQYIASIETKVIRFKGSKAQLNRSVTSVPGALFYGSDFKVRVFDSTDDVRAAISSSIEADKKNKNLTNPQIVKVKNPNDGGVQTLIYFPTLDRFI